MKFGVFFDLAMPRPWRAEGEYVLFAQAIEQLRLAEDLGIEYCWAAERNFLEEYWHGSAPEVFLAAFSQNTRKMRIGYINQMVLSINHPARVSARLGTLDLLSHGRVEWGYGWPLSRIERESLNVPDEEFEIQQDIAVRECAKMQCAEPYPGSEHPLFEMETRNVLPKPAQQPHPPLWRVCEVLKDVGNAGSAGVGVIWIGDPTPNAIKLVTKYYNVALQAECNPLGRRVNPQIAVVTPYFCGSAGEEREGLKFRDYAANHFHRLDRNHRPNQEDIWNAALSDETMQAVEFPACGPVAKVKAYFSELEALGVDQIILVHQIANVDAETTLSSLQALGENILPEFKRRDLSASQSKRSSLAELIERAESKVPDLAMEQVPEVDSYPSLSRRLGIDVMTLQQGRAPLGAAMWRLQVGGPRRKKPKV